MKTQNIIITGASSGIGKATAILLAKSGFTVFLIARNKTKLTKVQNYIIESGGIAYIYAADLSDFSQVKTAFKDVDKRFKKVDVIINCAAMPAGNIFSSDIQDWHQVINTNISSTLYCCRESANRMKGNNYGHIINIGSLCVSKYDKGCDLYVATKTAIAGFTSSLRKEMSDYNIAVTLINPGTVASNMVSETESEKKKAIEEFAMLKPEDVAQSIYFCLDQAERCVITELEIIPRKSLNL